MNNYVAFYYDPENKEQLKSAATYFACLAGGEMFGVAEKTPIKTGGTPNGKEVETPEPVKAEKVETPEPKKAEAPEPVKAEKAEDEEKPKKKTAPKKKAAPKKKEEPKEEVDEAEESEGASISLDELRQALSSKVKTHKEELRAKMRELGAKNISTLEESKYDEFYSYIKTLD